MNAYLILILAWIIYFFIHSALATEKVKNIVSEKLPSLNRFYRLFYSLISTVGLMYLLLLNGAIKEEPFFVSEGVIRYLSLGFTAFGVIIISQAFKQYRFSSFVGLAAEDSKDFKRSGILAKVRHPIYSGLILIVIGFFLFIPNLPTLISCLCILAYLPIGIYLEEQKLIKLIGQKYIAYKKEVPAIMPKLW
ncbi:MAG TPA: isoprenylcysteine carboxylmethyltransferase family protein [Cyclobacteriaceae bacterium]|nr:isoprenylcysteine carboxylmethyltransferase family protein [Cyclobacteriaceae bacterium]